MYGVQDILEGLPNFDSFISPANTGRNWIIYSWNRPTIGWSLECEAEGKTRQDAMEALSTPTVSSTMDTKLFKRFGITLLLVYLIGFVIALLFHFGLYRRFNGVKTAYWMIVFVYIPSRIFFLVYCPWILAAAGSNKSDLEAQHELVEKMDYLNECGDAYTKVDTEQASS